MGYGLPSLHNIRIDKFALRTRLKIKLRVDSGQLPDHALRCSTHLFFVPPHIIVFPLSLFPLCHFYRHSLQI